MEISEKVVRFKYHILFAAIIGLSGASLLLLAPRFFTLLAYFWPLFLSTALFLAAVLVFARTSPPAADASAEGLLDYVAGQPHHDADAALEETYQNENPPDDNH